MAMEITSRANFRRDAGSENLEFNYGCVSANVAKFLMGQADRIRRQCVTSIIQIGKALLEAKRHLSHGQFLGWVENEVGMSSRTAQAYMRVASWASGKGATVAHLKPSVLYLLSSSNTPSEFVADILNRIEEGEKIKPSALRRELVVARDSQERCVEITSSQELQNSHRRVGSMTVGVMEELVSILVRGLSETDFARVKDLATSDAVLFDPDLAKSLQRAFRHNGFAGNDRHEMGAEDPDQLEGQARSSNDSECCI